MTTGVSFSTIATHEFVVPEVDADHALHERSLGWERLLEEFGELAESIIMGKYLACSFQLATGC